MTTTASDETWVEVDDPELAKDDVPVSRDVSTRRVLVLQTLVLAASALVALALSAFDLESGPDEVLLTGAKLGSAAVALSVVDRLGWYRRVGFRSPRRWNRLWLAWLPATYVAWSLAGGDGDAAVMSALGIVGLSLAVGLEQELWTRGLLLESLRWRGTTVAVVVSSLWFALLQVITARIGPAGSGALNLIGDRSIRATFLHLAFAAAFGLAVAAVRVRVGTLWLPIGLHALYSLGILLGGTEALGEGWRDLVGFLVVFVLPLAVFGLVLARPSMVPGPDGRMPRRLRKVEPWTWPEGEVAARAEAANVLGRWPAPPPQLLDQWYRR